MSTNVIKVDPEQDFYVVWESIVEAPVAFGPRAEVEEYLSRDRRHAEDNTPAMRLDRADRTGTSALWPSADEPYMGWHDEAGEIYMQQGFLSRRNMIAACGRLAENDQADIRDLLTPFEDET